MSEAIELEQWWADIADELGVQAAYLHVHGMDWRGRTDGNEVVARAVATIARLTAEIATFQAMMLDCEAERDALAADLAALREDNAFLTGQWHAAADGLAALRARVEAAVARCQRTISAWNTNHGAVSYFRCEEASDLLAILSPPEAPTDKGAAP